MVLSELFLYIAESYTISMIRLGFHMSIAGGVANAPKEAAARGYACFQMFSSNARSWKGDRPEKSECLDFMRCVRDNDLEAFGHMPYICNISSSNHEVYEKSKKTLVANIRNCEALGVCYLVVHMGSHLGSGIELGIGRASEALSNAIQETKSVTVLMENSSGYHNSVGSDLGDLGRI